MELPRSARQRSSHSRTRRSAGLVRLVAAFVLMLGAVALPPLVSTSVIPVASATTDPVIAAVGDIACDPANSGYNNGNGDAQDCQQKATANLLSPTGAIGPVDAVLGLGDEQYNCGGGTAFQQVYNPTWGAQKANTKPVPGNHEYQNSGGTNCPTAHDASAYFNYFGSAAGDPAKGYYSYNLGQWHIIALNSEQCFGQSPYDQSPVTPGCQAGSAQETWLKADLAGNHTPCTLAYWHEPRYSSPSTGDDTLNGFFTDLYNAHADVVLTGHQHFYERFALQDDQGHVNANGIREFVVGTGGESLMTESKIAPNSQAHSFKDFGVLKMGLHNSSYDWNFLPIGSSTFGDSGTQACHGAPATDTTAPTTTATVSPAPNAAGWNNSNPTVTLTAADNAGGSGVAKTYYTTDGSTPTTSSPTYSGPISVNSTRTVKFFSTDNSGNPEAVKSQLVQVDTLAPTTTATCDGAACTGTYAGSTTVALGAGDGAGGSGIAWTRYTTDGTDPSSSSSAQTYSAPFSVTSTSTVKFLSADKAGNIEATKSQVITVGAPAPDTTPPSTSIACGGTTCAGTYYSTPVSVSLVATDTGGSGVASTRYTTDGSDPTTSPTALTYAGAFTLSSTATVRYFSTDNAGNVEPVQPHLIRVDTAIPSTTVNCNGGVCATWYRNSVTVGLAASPGGSGVTTRYTTDGTDPRTSSTAAVYGGPFSVPATSTIQAYSTDAAGNDGPLVTQAVQIDTIAPTTPIKCGDQGDPCASTPYSGSVKVTLAAFDSGGSGLAKTVYTTDGSDPATSPTAITYSQPFSLTATTTVNALSVDVAGNVGATTTQVIQVAAGSGTPASVTVAPTDDAYTAKGNATATHATEGSLNVNSGTSERRIYTKFNVTGIPAGATNITASLRLYGQSSAPATVTFTASQVDTNWTQTALTWNNQPALGATLSTKAGMTDSAYNAFAVTGPITGNGTYAFALTDNNTTQRYFNSKEAASNRPQLVVSYVA